MAIISLLGKAFDLGSISNPTAWADVRPTAATVLCLQWATSFERALAWCAQSGSQSRLLRLLAPAWLTADASASVSARSQVFLCDRERAQPCAPTTTPSTHQVRARAPHLAAPLRAFALRKRACAGCCVPRLTDCPRLRLVAPVCPMCTAARQPTSRCSGTPKCALSAHPHSPRPPQPAVRAHGPARICLPRRRTCLLWRPSPFVACAFGSDEAETDEPYGSGGADGRALARPQQLERSRRHARRRVGLVLIALKVATVVARAARRAPRPPVARRPTASSIGARAHARPRDCRIMVGSLLVVACGQISRSVSAPLVYPIAIPRIQSLLF